MKLENFNAFTDFVDREICKIINSQELAYRNMSVALDFSSNADFFNQVADGCKAYYWAFVDRYEYDGVPEIPQYIDYLLETLAYLPPCETPVTNHLFSLIQDWLSETDFTQNWGEGKYYGTLTS